MRLNMRPRRGIRISESFRRGVYVVGGCCTYTFDLGYVCIEHWVGVGDLFANTFGGSAFICSLRSMVIEFHI